MSIMGRYSKVDIKNHVAINHRNVKNHVLKTEKIWTEESWLESREVILTIIKGITSGKLI